MRIIPKEDMMIFHSIPSFSSLKIGDSYKDGVHCNCGNTIYLKNREPYETIKIVCPDCNSEIIYG